MEVHDGYRIPETIDLSKICKQVAELLTKVTGCRVTSSGAPVYPLRKEMYKTVEENERFYTGQDAFDVLDDYDEEFESGQDIVLFDKKIPIGQYQWL